MPTSNSIHTLRDIAPNDPRLKGVVITMKKHRKRPDALIEVLHSVEDLFGYIPLGVMHYLSKEMKIPASRIYGVATFYHFFSLKPKGENTVSVCTGTACHVKGAAQVLQAIQNGFQIKSGQTTPDGKLGLQTARCLGCCGLAPAVVCNQEMLAKVNPGDVVSQLKEKTGV